MRALVVAAVVTMSVPAAAKPGAIFIPPMAVELGAGSPIAETPYGTTTELRVGGSWASLYWKPTHMDVSVGYIGSYRSLGPDAPPHLDVDLHGVYFEVAYALENHRHWRTWLAARVETMGGDYDGRSIGVVGAALRIGSELYSTGVRAASDRRAVGLVAGAFALGVYVEGTARTVPDELGPLGLGAGVSMRVPFIAAIAD